MRKKNIKLKYGNLEIESFQPLYIKLGKTWKEMRKFQFKNAKRAI